MLRTAPFLGLALLVLALLGCSRNGGDSPPSLPGGEGGAPLQQVSVSNPEEKILDIFSLDEIAELERSGGFVPGLALKESLIRENGGDYAGAVIAAFKELSWAYAYGAEVSRENILEGLQQVLALYDKEDAGREGQEAAAEAALGVLAFLEGRWSEARPILESLFSAEEEPDSFSRWMLLVCDLEEGGSSRPVQAAYRAIRARYEYFPEYWYRISRYGPDSRTADYAERCINLAPGGPYAEECRGILADYLGLSSGDGPSLRSMSEIENLITRSISAEDPGLLTDLLPLITLPDNPYTLYAAGAMRALSARENFKRYFSGLADKSSGRLAERLRYISRG